MSKITANQFAKLLADQKVLKILKVTPDEAGLTPKQISKATKIPNNQLYYTLNKMVDADLLHIIKQRQVKNLTENYYSSSHFGRENDRDNQMLDLTSDWVQKNSEQTIQFVMLQHQSFIDALQTVIDNKEKNPDLFSMHSELELSPEGEKKLVEGIKKLLTEADPNPDSKQKKSIKIQFEKW